MIRFLRYFVRWLLHLLSTIRQWDWSLILLFFLISTVVWIFNALNKEDYTHTIPFPIEFVVDSVYVPLVPLPKELHIEVKGSGWQLMKKSWGIGNEPIVRELVDPLRSKFMTSGSFINDLEESLSELQIVDIQEDTIFFQFDSLVFKKVAIQPNLEKFTLEEGYRVISSKFCTPDSVALILPSSLANILPSTYSIPINESNVDDTYEEGWRLDFRKWGKIPLHVFLESSHEKVQIKIPVDLYFKRKSLIKVIPLNFPADSSVTIENKDIELLYEVSRVDELLSLPDTVPVVVHYGDIQWSDSTLVPMVNLPPFCQYSIMQPEKLKVIVHEKSKKNSHRDHWGHR